MKATPWIVDGALAYRAGARDRVVQVGSDEWWHWLEAPTTTRFRFEGESGSFTARRERRGDHSYWYAYRRRGGQLAKAYLGRSPDLDLDRLAAGAARLSQAGRDGPSRPKVARRSLSHNGAAGPHNLPFQTDPLIGRDMEVERVQARLLSDEVRLLTLTGPGGTGKTRLAIGAAEEMLPRFEHGVLFVDLAPVVSRPC